MLEFKGILLKTRKKQALDKWIMKVKKLKIEGLNSFIKGLELDYEAVLNSIKYLESNGLVEASDKAMPGYNSDKKDVSYWNFKSLSAMLPYAERSNAIVSNVLDVLSS